MSEKHGVFVSEQPTSVTTPVVAPSGVPFVIGAAPVQKADSPSAVGRPVVCTSWNEFVERFGYSEEWDKYNLCEFAYSHFQLYGCQPAIFCNVLDVSTMKSPVTAADKDVIDHRVVLEAEGINDANLIVKTTGSSPATLVKDTDYVVFYGDDGMVVELLSTGEHYEAESLNVAYNKVTPASVTASAVVAAMNAIDLCMSTVGTIPDLICAPGYSHEASVAAIMATKAEGLNGLFRAKALVDLDCSSGGCTSYSGVADAKAAASMVSDNQIVCWPMVAIGNKKFHLSTQLAGLMAYVDTGNGNPYESPSNKRFRMDSLILADGTEVLQTKAQADTIVEAGVVTALNFLSSGWVCWGNYTACYPASTDVKDYFIPISRMFDWVGNTLVQTFWSKLDMPMNRRLIDTVLDTCNIWLNGLVGSEYVLGARIEMLDAENPLTDLMAGIIRLHIHMTPPAPAQEIDFLLEYDASYVERAFV